MTDTSSLNYISLTKIEILQKLEAKSDIFRKSTQL